MISFGGPFVTWLLSPLWPLIIPCLLLVAIKKLWYEYNVRTFSDPDCPLPLPEGTMGWPIIGETPLMAIQGGKYYEQRFKKYGRIFKTHVFGRPTIRVIGADHLRKVLTGEEHIVESSWAKSTTILLGPQSLTQSKGQSHAKLKKVVAAAFKSSALKDYVPLIQDRIQETISDWCKEDSVLAYPECRSLTFRVASKVLCGFDYGKKEMERLTSAFTSLTDNALFSLPFDYPGFGFHQGLKDRQLIFDRIEAEYKKEDLLEGHTKPTALRILAEEHEKETGEKLTLRQVQETIVDLIMAGFVSTASASTTLVLQLFKHPEVLQRVREELEANDLDKPGTPLTYDSIQNLKYLNCVVKESLRLSPPVGGGFRKALKTFEIDGYQVPKGWTVIYSIRDTMKISEIYSEKDKFDPDRFSEERAEDRNGDRYHYSIFGHGIRSCLGKPFALLKLKVLVVELARSCNWEVMNPDKLRFKLMPVPYPVDGMPVRFTLLKDHNSNSVKSTSNNKSTNDFTDTLQTLVAA